MAQPRVIVHLISLHESEDPIFGIDVVPFLATGYGEARKLWAASKPAIERRLAAQGLIVLFAVPWPPQGIFANKEINDIATQQLAAHGMKVLPPSGTLQADLQRIGERLTGEWLTRAGTDGLAVIEAYRKQP
jgi:TRAP-type C4-dicarboxylate transport system substrate-binding protein